MEAIRHSCELQGNGNEAEADLIVAVGSLVVVAVGDTAVWSIRIPTAAANHAVPALWRLTFFCITGVVKKG